MKNYVFFNDEIYDLFFCLKTVYVCFYDFPFFFLMFFGF